MASGSGHGIRLPSSGVRGGDHLRSVKGGSHNHHAKLFHAGRGLAYALLLLLMLRVLGQGLILGVAGAALVLLLQELADPTPLFWSALGKPCNWSSVVANARITFGSIGRRIWHLNRSVDPLKPMVLQ